MLPLKPRWAMMPPASMAPLTTGGSTPTLLKKKKKKPKKEVENEEDGGEEGAAGGEDGGLDLTMKKKKKKKPVGQDDFAAKLKALDLDGKEVEGDEGDVDEGDMDKGTGIWGHDVTTPTVPFNLLLQRFYTQLELRNPDHTTSGSRSYKIPPPQCLREGNKKTIFANIVEISKRMKRAEEHLSSYLFAELGTTGSVDGNRRLVIKGRFQQKQIENVLRKYILGKPARVLFSCLTDANLRSRTEYVTCRVRDSSIAQDEARRAPAWAEILTMHVLDL